MRYVIQINRRSSVCLEEVRRLPKADSMSADSPAPNSHLRTSMVRWLLTYNHQTQPSSARHPHRKSEKRPRTVHEHVARRGGKRARDPVELAREVDLAAEARRVGQAEGHVEHVVLVVLQSRRTDRRTDEWVNGGGSGREEGVPRARAGARSARGRG